jgi:hypothetical protein
MNTGLNPSEPLLTLPFIRFVSVSSVVKNSDPLDPFYRRKRREQSAPTTATTPSDFRLPPSVLHLLAIHRRAPAPTRPGLTCGGYGSQLSDMKTNARDFARRFSAFKTAAAKGASIEIHDSQGKHFVFMLKRPAPANFAEAVAPFKGMVSTKVKKKTLAGYGRPT